MNFLERIFVGVGAMTQFVMYPFEEAALFLYHKVDCNKKFYDKMLRRTRSRQITIFTISS